VGCKCPMCGAGGGGGIVHAGRRSYWSVIHSLIVNIGQFGSWRASDAFITNVQDNSSDDGSSTDSSSSTESDSQLEQPL
jgi:hypothetical protein